MDIWFLVNRSGLCNNHMYRTVQFDIAAHGFVTRPFWSTSTVSAHETIGFAQRMGKARTLMNCDNNIIFNIKLIGYKFNFY